MARIKISALTAATSPTSTDNVPIVSGGSTGKISLAALWQVIGVMPIPSITIGMGTGVAPGKITVNNTTSGSTDYEIGNGTWYSTAVAYFRSATNRGIALDIMPKGPAADTWVDVCSTDIVADSSNFETVRLFKTASGPAQLSTTKAGTGTIRDLGLQTFGGNVGIGTDTPVVSGAGSSLHLTGDTIRLATQRTPASASATGNAGERCWDSTYDYRCIATNTWQRLGASGGWATW